MPSKRIPIPIKGINKGLPILDTPNEYSSDMKNVRPKDVLEGRIRLGQRPGLKKVTETRLGGENQPIVAMCFVSSID